MALEKIRPRVVDETGNYTFNNVTATGNLVTLNANLGNVAVANYVKTDNLLYSNGSPWSFGGGGGATVAGSNTQVQFNNSGSFGSSANFVFDRSTNRLTVDNITANGAALTNLTGANVTGTVGNANFAAYAGNITLSAQSNITSVGTLTSLDVTGNISSGNANLGNFVIANFFSGSGNNLSNIQGSNITGAVSYATTANSIAGANVSGQVTYAATANAVAGANVFGFVANSNIANTAYSVAGANVSGAVSYATTANSVAGANVSGQVGNASLAGTVTTNAQPNITSVGTLSSLSVTGDIGAANLTLTGNLIVSGSTTSVNSTVTRIVDPIFELGAGANGAGLSADDNKDRGLLLHYYSGASPVDAFMGWDDSNAEFAFGSNVTVASEVTTFNSLGNVRANFFIGNGSSLTGIAAITAVSLINGNSNVVVAANSNVTVSVTGVANIATFTNTGVNVAGRITSTGNIDAGSNYFLGNGYYLTGIDAAGQLANGTSNIRIPTAGANITFTVNGTTAANITSTGFVLLGTGNITAGNVYANAGTIGASALVGTLSTANQYNITTVGTLGNLAVTSNITSGNVFANSGIVKGQYIYGDGSNLTGLGGAGYIFNGTSNVFISTSGGNVSFTVGGYTNILNVTTTGANIGGYANVTGNLDVVGNITGGNANLGNAVVANYFTGNFYGNANTAGTVITNAQPNITSVGTLTSLDVTGTANLGTASNVKIGGGAANYFLKTDGSGNLSWAVPAGGGGGGGTSLTYTAGTNPPASGNILGDQWFNTSGNILYEYISDGSASYWVDVSGATTTTTVPTTLDLANVSIAGGSNGQALISNGAGGLSFANLTQANIYNGNSNVTVVANSNVTFNISGTSNVLTVTSTGANLVSTGTANLGNLVTANYVAGTLTTGAQPNITSIGILSSLTVTGAMTYGLSIDNLAIKTGATGVVTHDVTQGGSFYHTSPVSNFTANFTNVTLSDSKATVVALIIVQGATPYVPTTMQINGQTQTVKWNLGSTNPVGTASKTDIISYTIVKISGFWTVYGQYTYYG